MKRFLASLLTLVLLCALCVPALADTHTVDLAGGLTVEIPAKWTVMKTDPATNSGTALTASFGDSEISFEDNGEAPLDFSALGVEFMEILLPEMVGGFEESGLKVEESSVFDGGEACYFKLKSGMEMFGMRMSMLAYVGTHDDSAYSITGLYFGDVTPEIEAELDGIVSSIRFQ